MEWQWGKNVAATFNSMGLMDIAKQCARLLFGSPIDFKIAQQCACSTATPFKWGIRDPCSCDRWGSRRWFVVQPSLNKCSYVEISLHLYKAESRLVWHFLFFFIYIVQVLYNHVCNQLCFRRTHYSTALLLPRI